MSSWMNVCLQLVERKLQLSGRDKSNAALVYIVPYWVHITASPSQHTLLYQVWSKIKPFESYLISVLVSAELLLGLKKYFCSKLFAQTQEIFFAQKLFAQDQNWGSELCRPRICRTSGSRRATFATFYSRRAIMEDHTEHLLYTENDGEIWFEISAVYNVDISSPLYFSVISAVHYVDIVSFFSPGGFRQMPVLPLPPSSQDFPHPLVHW